MEKTVERFYEGRARDCPGTIAPVGGTGPDDSIPVVLRGTTNGKLAVCRVDEQFHIALSRHAIQTLLAEFDILRAENLLQNMDLITPDEGIRPSQIVAFGKMRERVRNEKQPGTGQTEWKWGDEQ